MSINISQNRGINVSFVNNELKILDNEIQYCYFFTGIKLNSLILFRSE
jgi:hypothetical protein